MANYEAKQSDVDIFLLAIIGFVSGNLVDLVVLLSNRVQESILHFYESVLRGGTDNWGIFCSLLLILIPPFFIGLGLVIGVVHDAVLFFYDTIKTVLGNFSRYFTR